MTTLADLNQAVELHQTGRLDEAESIYRRLIDADTCESNALNLLGVLCGQTDRTAEAVELLARAVQSRHAFTSAHYNYGNVLLAAGRHVEAAQQFRTVIGIDPEHASAHFNLGAVLLQLGQAEDAAESFRNAVRVNPGHDQAWHHLAMTLFGLEQHDAAAECWRCAIHANGDCLDYHHNLGHVLHALQRHDEAEGCYRAALAIQPDSAVTLSNLASLLRQLGRIEEAVECCRQAIRIDPACMEAINNLAALELQCGRLDEARELTDRALQQDPTHLAALITAVDAHQSTDDPQAILHHLEEIIAREPDQPLHHVRRAEVHREQGTIEAAMTDYRHALDLDERCTPARLGLARLLLGLGDVEATRTLIEPLSAEPTPDPSTTLLRCAVLEHDGRHDEAERVLLAALEAISVGEGDRRRLFFALGRVTDRLARPDEAIDWYVKANALRTETFEAGEVESLFERLIDTFSPAHLARLPRAVTRTDRGLFIVGMPRSGTTLIEQILDCHSDVTGGGEANIFVPTLLLLDDLIDMSSFPACLLDLTAEHVEILSADFIRRLDALGGDIPRIVEKTPENFRFLGLLQLITPGARVIWCRRHPLDTCLSCYFQDFNERHSYAGELDSLGRYHRLHERLMQHWLSVLDLEILEVRYEDLVNDQESVTRRLIEFAGVPWDIACLAPHANTRPVLTSSAEQVRRPVYATSVGRYRPYLAHLTPLIEALRLEPGEYE